MFIFLAPPVVKAMGGRSRKFNITGTAKTFENQKHSLLIIVAPLYQGLTDLASLIGFC